MEIGFSSTGDRLESENNEYIKAKRNPKKILIKETRTLNYTWCGGSGRVVTFVSSETGCV